MLYSPFDTLSTVVRRCRIVSYAQARDVNHTFNWPVISFNNSGLEFIENSVFIPRGQYIDQGGGNDTLIRFGASRRAQANIYVTDLGKSSGSSRDAHYSVDYGSTEAIDEQFTGTAPGIADTFRPKRKMTFDTRRRFCSTRPGGECYEQSRKTAS